MVLTNCPSRSCKQTPRVWFFFKFKCGTSQGTSFCSSLPPGYRYMEKACGTGSRWWSTHPLPELSSQMPDLTSMECLAFKWKPPYSIWTVLIYQPSKPKHSFWNICSSPKTCKASVNIVLIRTEYTATDIQYITCPSSATIDDLIESNNMSLRSALDLHVRSISCILRPKTLGSLFINWPFGSIKA